MQAYTPFPLQPVDNPLISLVFPHIKYSHHLICKHHVYQLNELYIHTNPHTCTHRQTDRQTQTDRHTHMHTDEQHIHTPRAYNSL